jgi:hypothetical protein
MTHPADGVLRRLLDEPAGVTDADRAHVAGCAHCLGTLTAMREDVAIVGTALAADGGAAVDVAAGWRRLSAATALPAGRSVAPARRARPLFRRPLVAALSVAVVLVGAGTVAANGWLEIFRTEQIAPIGFKTSDLNALPDLSAYGKVEVTREADVHAVSDGAAAEAETGLEVPRVGALPRGIVGEPTHQVASQVEATFTFSPERAAEAADAAGEDLPTVPPGLEGSTVRLVAGPGVAQVWASSAGAPGLIVGRAVAPSAISSGVPFSTVRDYLLALPGLPPDVAAQLRGFTGDGSTLPLPVPEDQFTTSSAEVNGRPATVLATRDRTLAAVVWVKDGLVSVVAGSPDPDELLAVAEELR